MQWEEITFELIFFHVIFYSEVTHKKCKEWKMTIYFHHLKTSKPKYLSDILYTKKLLSNTLCFRMSKGEKRKY
jgi:hypothetical protein